MKRSEERILTTHVGSLPRPPELLDASKQGSPEYEEILRRAVCEVVQKQADGGSGGGRPLS